MADYDVITCPMCDCTTRVERAASSAAWRGSNQGSPRCENCRVVLTDEGITRAQKLKTYAYNEDTKLVFVLLRKVKRLREKISAIRNSQMRRDLLELLKNWLDDLWRSDVAVDVDFMIHKMLQYDICYFDRNDELRFYDERGRGGYDDGCGKGRDDFWYYFMQKAEELRGLLSSDDCVQYDERYNYAKNTGDWRWFDGWVINLMIDEYDMARSTSKNSFELYDIPSLPRRKRGRDGISYDDEVRGRGGFGYDSDMKFLDELDFDFAEGVMRLGDCLLSLREDIKLQRLYVRRARAEFIDYAGELMRKYNIGQWDKNGKFCLTDQRGDFEK